MSSATPHSPMQRPFRRVLLALPALLALGAAPPFPLPAISAAERERLARGEVIVRLEEVRPGSPREGTGLAVIDFPPERIFRAVSDFAHYHEFMPFLVRSDAAPQRDGTAVVRQKLDLPAPMGDRTYQVRAAAGVHGQGTRQVYEARWTYVPGSGNVDDHRGSFTLVEFAPGRTLAACRLYTDPGGFVPDRSMDRATEKSLGWVFKALRLHARRSRYDGP